MPKYMVETISTYRMRYVVKADNAETASACVEADITGNHDLFEFSQLHLNEIVSSSRRIGTREYFRVFNEDNDYLQGWSDDQKMSFVNKMEYVTNTNHKELDPEQRDWEYDGCGNRVWKGTMKSYDT
jgi:hypothetical protein